MSKKLKGWLSAIVAIALIAFVGLSSAFISKKVITKEKVSNVWFLYNGTGDPSLPASYEMISGTPTCNGSGALCAIEGTEQGTTGQPTQATVDNPVATRDKN